MGFRVEDDVAAGDGDVRRNLAVKLVAFVRKSRILSSNICLFRVLRGSEFPSPSYKPVDGLNWVQWERHVHLAFLRRGGLKSTVNGRFRSIMVGTIARKAEKSDRIRRGKGH